KLFIIERCSPNELSSRVAQDNEGPPKWRRPFAMKRDPSPSARLRMTRFGGTAQFEGLAANTIDMTKTVLPLTIGLLAISFLRAQEISPSPSASATPARAVRISF